MTQNNALYPLSSVQREIWFDQGLTPEAPIYNIGGYHHIEGDFDPEIFRRALQQLVQETEILRLQLCLQDHAPWQSFPELPEIGVGYHDCRREADPMAAARAAMQADIESPFELLEGPLFRHALYRVAEKTHLWSQVYHHLLVDGWAISLIMQRTATLYQALRDKAPIPPPPSTAYTEFVASDQAYLTSAYCERDRQYWRQQFATLPEPLFVERHHRSAEGPVLPDPTLTLFLDRACYNRLGALAQKQGATIYQALVALFCLYFCRTTDRNECLLGMPVHNRNAAAFKETIGLFVSAIPVRFTINRETSFGDLIDTVGRTLRERYRHQRLPLSEINRLAGIFRDGRKNLFEVSLTFDHHEQHASINGQALTSTALANGYEQSPLSLYVREYLPTQDIQLDFAFNLAWFDPDDIKLLGKRILHLIDEILLHPECPLGQIDLLLPEERRQLLHDWNATTAPAPAQCAHHLVEAQAAATPEAIALVFGDETLSYAELNAYANQLAHHLIALGVQPDERIAIALERSPDMILSLLAVLKAGAAYVPLDPDYPPQRLAFMLADSGATLLVTRSSLQQHLQLQATHVICLDTDTNTFTHQPTTNPNRPVAPHHLAYVIYTSGSTGTPKGVMIEHGGLPNLVLAQSQAFNIRSSSRVLQFASFSFDAAVSEVFMALCNGAALYLPTAEERQPGRPLWQYLAQHAITHVTLPPSALAVLPQDALPQMESLIVAGEPCPPALAAFWAHGRRFFNGYGPTETTVCATIAECGEIDPAQPLPIGRPIANTRLYVLDRCLQPLPVGAAGELFIGGIGLARGYLNRPELTAERFIPDPFSTLPGQRLYRTGDLIRYRPDGALEFLGRIDQQVKIRGFRIELGEIENTLLAHPAIAEAVVVAENAASAEMPGEKRLVAHLVLTAGASANPRELRAFLKTSLPDYMLPAAWAFHKALPLTPNGKVDRKALAAPQAAEQAGHRTPPRDALEEDIAAIWRRLLKIDAPGIDDNFFDAGGHSLAATRLVTHLSETLGHSIPLRWVFEAPTIALLAERIRPLLTGNAPQDSAGAGITAVSRQQDLPLSFAQQRLWFLDQLEGASATYNMPGRLELLGDLDRPALTRALVEIIRRHEVLRTRLAEIDGIPVQCIDPVDFFEPTYLDLRDYDDPEGEALRLAGEEAATPFDLAVDPPVRITLLRCRETAWTLLVTLHHSAADAWSVAIFLEELTTLYAAFHAGRPSPLPELAVQYADFAVWQRHWFSGERKQQQLDYWCQRLTGAPECLRLPTDRPRPARQSYRGAAVHFHIPRELALAVDEFSRRANATRFMTLLAAWGCLLGRASGQEDIIIGSPIANRRMGTLEPLIGFFVNTLALRIDLSAQPAFSEVLARVRQTCLEAYAHQDLPFESLIESLAIPRRLDHAPLFQVMFALQDNRLQKRPRLPGLRATLIESPVSVAKFDLTLSISEADGGFAASLEYASDLFNRERIEGMAQAYLALLQTVLAQPEMPVSAPDRPLAPQSIIEPAASGPQRPAAPPDQHLQEVIAGVWGAFLGRSGLDVHDNFFELGGHSLLATRIATRLHEALGTTVPVRWMFEFPTIAGLAGRISENLNQESGSEPVPANRIEAGYPRITPEHLTLLTLAQNEIDAIVATVDGGTANIQDLYPLTPLQEGILFHHQMQTVGDAYLSHALLAFESRQRLETFLAAFQTVVDRHDVLRTAFVWQDISRPVQVVWRQAALPIQTVDFDPAQGPVADQLVAFAHPQHHRIDLNVPPLLRIFLSRDGARWLMLFLSHHLIMDHATLEVLLEEIVACEQGRLPELPAALPFRTFVHATLQGRAPAEHEAFFRQMLSDVDTPTAPFGLLDVQGDGSAIAEARQHLPQQLSDDLHRTTRSLGATPAALCHLAWALVLSRCCNRDDVVFGTVLFGRMQGGGGIERAIGLFINALPIRIRCDGPALEALRETQQTLLALMRHEHASLSLAQRCSAVPPPAPLFSSLLNYRHSTQAVNLSIPGIELLASEERSNYPFDLSIDDVGDRFVLTAQVDDSVDPRRICALMQQTLTELVTLLNEAPQTPLASLTVLPPAERQQLLFDWNATTAPAPAQCVHQLFEAQAAASPEAIALVFAGESLSYGGLNTRANQLAHALIASGVQPDARIAIALERSPDMIVALLAVLKAGAAYVPLDPDYPRERLAFMLADSGAALLITHSALQQRLRLEATHILCLDNASSIPQSPLSPTPLPASGARGAHFWDACHYPATNPDRPVQPHHLAYVIYTSGSTGTPKGVMVEHGAIASHIANVRARYQLSSRDRVLQFASFSFDTALEQILPILSTGGQLVLPPQGLLTIEVLDALLRQTGITVLNLPPALFRLWASACQPSPLLRLILLGGEALPPDAPQLRARWPKPWPRLCNAYGPTETTITATLFEIPGDWSGATVPIGRPLPGRRLYVLNSHLQPLPVGAAGELFIGGIGLARGYLNRPELTAERFIPDPFSTLPDQKLYRTGDLVRYRPDGTLEFLGRIDQQVKIRGFRIELGEIESLLKQRDDIEDAVAVADGDTLSAYIVLCNNRISGGDVDYRLVTVAQTPALENEMEQVHTVSWPAFFAGDLMEARYWPKLYRVFPDFQFALLRNNACAAVGNMAPLYWDGEASTLPSGWDEALERAFLHHQRGTRPNTLCVLAGAVTHAAQGNNLSYALIASMAKIANRSGFQHLIVPVRPTMKPRYPHMTLPDYAALLRDEDQQPLDPWLRVHHCLGGRILGFSERSQKIEGSLADWREWSGLDFPASGEYTVKGALQPVHIDLEHNLGVYYDQSVWIEHDLSKFRDDLPHLTTRQELRAFLAARLPAYMLPSRLDLIDRIPLTVNGKVDRKALLERQETREGKICKAPRNDRERQLVRIWEEALSVRPIGIEDDFFESGGHSLIATQIAARLGKEFGLTVPVRWLFETPTIAGLAERLRAGGDKAPAAVPPNLILPGTRHITPELLPLVTLAQDDIDRIVATVEGGAANIEDIYPLLPLQEGILFHHQMQSVGDPYLGHALLAAKTYEHCRALISALQKLIDHHDVLRTAVVWQGLPEPVQVVWRQASLAVETRHFDPAQGPIAEQLVASCHPRHTRLDLSRPPLMRLVLAEDRERWLILIFSHHLVADHTSLDVLLKELSGQLQDEPEHLPPYVPYRNFVHAARTGLSAKEHQDFFRQMLSDVASPTTPFGLVNVLGDGTSIIEAGQPLPSDLAKRLRHTARQSGVTPAALCHLAWALVLSRCCNRDDVVFGTVLFGRMQGGEGIAQALGLFINSLPIRIACDGPALEALRKTQQTLLALMRHEHAPLSLAQRCSAVPASMPLFSSLLNYRHSPDQSAFHLEGIEPLDSLEQSNYPFDLSINDLGEDFTLIAQVDASIDPLRICAFMQQALSELVTALDEAPQTPLTSLNVLPPEELHRLRTDWNPPLTPMTETCVHRLFEAQAAARPEAAALVFGNDTLSYGELNARANQLAHALIALGVQPDMPVAIALERSPGMIVALLAVLKAGGAYVPLDPDYPPERLAFMCADSGAQILITEATLRSCLPHGAGHILCLDSESEAIRQHPRANPAVSITPRHLAYVLYTSGSTGAPKGVAIEHRSIAQHCQDVRECYALTAQDRVLQFASFSFDTSAEQILSSLGAGACLVLPPHGLAAAESLDPLLRQHHISVLDLPPALFRLWSETCPPPLPPDLRLIILGGDVLPPEALALRATWPQPWPRILNAYGPTEATVTTTVFELPESWSGSSVPIGRPLPRRTIYVLDAHGHPVPIGVASELHIGGIGLARGYLNRPELTAERFIPDPFSTLPDQKLYRTGDLVRYRPDGTLEFLGRIDQQVKIRGFRIELGEIENALSRHPDVRAAVVMALADASGAPRLVAHLVLTSGAATGPDELRAFLNTSLPDYMLPAAWVFHAALPLTPNGKIDRKALAAPQEQGAAKTSQPPRNSVERQLVEIWEKLLSVHPIGINDHFFQTGGHSLLAVRLVSEIDRSLGRRLPVSRIFQFPTIAGIAALLQQEPQAEDHTCLVRIRASGTRPPLFFLPGAGGITHYLYPLAQALDAEIPFFTFQAQGLEGTAPPHADIEEMARHYLELLREVQPHGPYHLGGHSLGGIVAFAMAQALMKDGEEIALLAVVDACAPGILTGADEELDETSMLLDLARVLAELGGQTLPLTDMTPTSRPKEWTSCPLPSPPTPLPQAGEGRFVRRCATFTLNMGDFAGLSREEQIPLAAGKLEGSALLPKGDGIHYLRTLLNVYQAHTRAASAYSPAPQPLPAITLLRALESPPGPAMLKEWPEDLGWRRYSCRTLDIIDLPGNHLTMMMPPHVTVLAKTLEAKLTDDSRPCQAVLSGEPRPPA